MKKIKDSETSLGFYLWAYDNHESVEYIISRLRCSHPFSEIVISSDGGKDFSLLAERFKIKKYIHSNHSHGPSHSSLEGNGRYGWTVGEARLWLERVYDACKTIESEYVMLMEEDVLVKEKFTFSSSDIIMIPNFKNPISTAGMDWVRKRGGLGNYNYYSAGGGSIIKREFFIKAFEKNFDSFLENYEEIYQQSMIEGKSGWGWNDSIICVLMYTESPRVTQDLPILETGEEDDPAPIIHKFKKYYVKNLKPMEPESKPKIVFYHVYLEGNYQLIIQEQLFKLMGSGLYKESDSIQLHIASPDESRIPWILNIVKKYRKIVPTVVQIDKTRYPSDYRESKITLMNLKKMSEEIEGYYCYFHSKGVSNHGYLIDLWRMSCDYATIWEWEKNLKMLNDGYDAVGPNLRPNSHIGNHPHFSGCYWWTKSSHIKNLDFSYLTDVTNKYLEEFWIGSNPNAKLGSSFECGHTQPYLIETTIDKFL